MLALNARLTAAQQLKDQTKENHEATEAIVVARIKTIKQGGDYISFLKSFYGYYHPLEKQIAKYLDASRVPDLEARRKSSLILDDLRAMGADVSSIPLAKQLLSLQGPAAAMGALYVLEGSTLGGRYIAGMLVQQYPALQLQQLQFFTGYGARTGLMWTSFLERLNKFAVEEEAVRQMASAANQTFLHLKLWLTSQQA